MIKFISEFKDFINRGNVVDLAVAVVMGAAFTAIINALVGDFITPLLSILTLGIDFSTLTIPLGEGLDAASLKYGSFIEAVLKFLIVALVVFLLIKGINKLIRKKPATTKECPYCMSTISEAALRCPQCTTILDAQKIPKDLR